MDSKYYTPHPSEFGVGFEYYISSDSTLSVYEINMPDKFYSNLDKVYLKFLDETDLKLLGWNFIFNTTQRTKSYKYKNYLLYHNKNNLKIRIGQIDKNELQGYKEYFNGVIRNKFELYKLMQQIGIIKMQVLGIPNLSQELNIN